MAQDLNLGRHSRKSGGRSIVSIVITVTEEYFIPNSEISPNVEISSHGKYPVKLKLK